MTRPVPPESRRVIGRLIADGIGGEAATRAYYDEPETHVVSVLEATGAPSEGLMTFATTSLHSAPNVLEGQDVRTELMLVTDGGLDWGGEIVATSATNVSKSGWLVGPGMVFPGVVSEFDAGSTTPHIMWDSPFTFPELSSLSADELGHSVYPLQGCPITDSEWEFLKREGYFSFVDLLERFDVPYWDFHRASVC